MWNYCHCPFIRRCHGLDFIHTMEYTAYRTYNSFLEASVFWSLEKRLISLARHNPSSNTTHTRDGNMVTGISSSFI